MPWRKKFSVPQKAERVIRRDKEGLKLESRELRVFHIHAGWGIAPSINNWTGASFCGVRLFGFGGRFSLSQLHGH